MDHINFSIKENLIYLKLNSNENIFNNGLIYFQNLDFYKNFFHIKDITNIKNISNVKNYIIFVNKFRDNLDILDYLKTEFKFITINLSFECFWLFLKLDKRSKEKIIYDNNSFNIKLNFNTQINTNINVENKKLYNQNNFILENIDTLEVEINQYKEKILNESVEKLKIEYDKIKKNIEKLNLRIKNLDNYTVKLIDNNQSKIEQIYKKETLLEEIRELKSKKEEYDKLIKKNQNIFENIKKKKLEEDKLKERITNYELKLFNLKNNATQNLKDDIKKYEIQLLNLKNNAKQILKEDIQKYELKLFNLKEDIQKHEVKLFNLKNHDEQNLKECIKKYESKLLNLKNHDERNLKEDIKKYESKLLNLKNHDEQKLKESITTYEIKLLKLKNDINNKEQNKQKLQQDFKNLNDLILKENFRYNKLIIESKNIIKNNILKKKEKKIGILVHLFNISLWKEIYLYILNLKKFKIYVDLYVNLAVNNKDDLLNNDYINLKKKITEISWFNKIIITDTDNKGMDSGGFLTSYLKVLDSNVDYDFIIKIHSKTNDNWRNLLLYSLLGNDKIIQNNFNLIDNEKIGMIGYQTLSLNEDLVINKKSYKFMDEYIDLFNIKKTNSGFFIPGTIFIVKDYILKEYLTKKTIGKIYENFKSNYCGLIDNKLEERPHALERLYGIMVYNMKLNVISYDKKIS